MPKKRSESFFGMHFDFHAGPNQKNIGEFCDYDTIDQLISAVKPDYVQCDTKGHPGISSYPTKVGNPAPEMKGDILRMWRDVTKRYDVALYGHHSGVWDAEALKKHPDWAACDVNGNPDSGHTSCFGPYADEQLIPELTEMAIDYELDGAWVDGDCWAAQPDYSKWSTEQYKMRYSAEPPASDSEDYYQFMKFCRHGFRDYVNKYVRALHSIAPNFQLTSNWMYTSFMPEAPTIPVDFISGDYEPNNSLNSARFEGRAIASQEKCWDLMAWGFSLNNGCSNLKEYEQLCQEAAEVIMLGGGFQFYNPQLVGSVLKRAIPMWSDVAKFCREREELCHNAKAVPQVGIILSRKANYHDIGCLYTNHGKYTDEVRNTLLAVLDAGYSAEILMTHKALACDLNKYGCIIVTDLNIIESDLRCALLDYANNGGKLVISGYNSAQLFIPYLDIDIIGGSEEPCNLYLEDSTGHRGTINSPYRDIMLTYQAKPLAYFDFADNNNAPSHVAASVTDYGNGNVCGIYFNIGSYMSKRNAAVKRTIRDILGKLFKPAVRVNEHENVEVALMQKDGELRVNLLNLNGDHNNPTVSSFERVPHIYNLSVCIDCKEQPVKVVLEPSGEELEYEYSNGVIKTVIPDLHIHSVICIK